MKIFNGAVMAHVVGTLVAWSLGLLHLADVSG